MSVLRLFLFWLLAVAVPLQGYAASRMLFCGGQPSRLAQAHEHAPAGAQQHAAHADAAALNVVEAAPAGSPHGLASAHDCSVCTACCHAVALTQAADVPHIAAAPAAGAEPAPVAVPTRTLRLPEKPPRA